MDEQTEQVAVNELRAQVQAFVEAIRSETDPDTWDRIFRRMKSIMSSEGTGNIPDVEVVNATALPAAP
jgi:hypothetical protein